jgi:hypothetical protein
MNKQEPQDKDHKIHCIAFIWFVLFNKNKTIKFETSIDNGITKENKTINVIRISLSIFDDCK